VSGSTPVTSSGEFAGVDLLRSPIPPAQRTENIELSPNQRRLAADFDLLQHPGSNWATITISLDVDAAVGELGVRAAVTSVAAAWDALRTVYLRGAEVIRQSVLPEYTPPVRVVRLAPADDIAAGVGRVVAEESGKVLDIFSGPPWSATLVITGGTSDQLIVSCHHLMTDGSTMLLLREYLQTALRGEPLKVGVQYAAYTDWYLRLESSGALDDALRERCRDLDGALPDTLASLRLVPPASSPASGSAASLFASSETLARLQRATERAQVTLTELLLAAYVIALREVSGEDELVLNTPLRGRTHRQLQRTIGLCDNLMAIRARGGERSLAETLSQVAEAHRRAVRHQLCQNDTVAKALGVDREYGRYFFTDTFFSRVKIRDRAPSLAAHDVMVRALPHEVHYQAILYAFTFDDGIWLDLRYRDAMFDAQAMRGLLERFVTMLEAF
jgi:hypothetical protein